MKKIYYEIHSDLYENYVLDSFSGRGSKQAAIKFANDHRADKTWVERVSYNMTTNEYEYLGIVWYYDFVYGKRK